MISDKTWSIKLLVLVAVMLGMTGMLTIVIDPYFHYHAPLDGLEYPIHNERYQNNGIVRHFTYDAIITGTSMTQNFKTSEFDHIFDVHSIKVPFSGGSYKEINNNLRQAVKANTDIRIILRGLDYGALLEEKDTMRYENYPLYLYDNLLFNDVEYIWNKTILLKDTYTVISYTRDGNKTTTFDEYNNWMSRCTFGKKAVDAAYDRPGKSEEMLHMTNADYKLLYANLKQNIIELAEKNRQIEFYLFFTPYSIYYWDSLNQSGELEKQLEAEKKAIEILLDYENIHLFSFHDDFAMICDLNHYKDMLHYGESVNSKMLLCMKKADHLLTKENYTDYYQRIYDFYTTYDYDALFEK